MLKFRSFFYHDRHYIIASLYFTFLIALISCEDHSFYNLNQYIEKIKAEQKAEVKHLPEIKQIEPFIFNAKGLRNPFIPFATINDLRPTISHTGDRIIAPNIKRPKEVLESFSLDTLKMVGTINIRSNVWALIKAEDNIIYKAHLGSYLGKNYGKITQISINKIDLTEMMSDQSGLWRERQASLDLTE